MATRVPLIINPSASQIQEVADGDTLDLSNVVISGATTITGTTNLSTDNATIGNLTVSGQVNFIVRSSILTNILF